MQSPFSKQNVHKSVKNNSQITLHQASTPRIGRSATPQQATKNYSGMQVVQKHVTKEHTKPVDFRLHTQQRAVSRAIYNYTVATKVYIMERQKKQVEKVQKMIEEEEVKMLRKEMVPKAQLMPRFNKPFHPQRSTRPLTIPKEPSMMSDKCSSRFSFYNLFSLRYNEAH
ncbi:TPX2 domain-containing protein [Heracleum sosnowskyi]|uniref:TPX2 domain-containing protein n=1 Tax=Heracleum sosnowskyi TaxID=360622 RepID=A0AAD8HRK4_9APIA|nr:TPX2 domain-containing protein [Heracleum sosnowskyi]